MSKLAFGQIECGTEDAGFVLTTLSKLDELEEYGWRDGKAYWTLGTQPAEYQLAHEAVRRKAQRAISLHAVAT